MQQVLVIGHSHMNALTATARHDPAFRFVHFKQDAAYLAIEPEVFASFNDEDFAAVVFMLHGSMHITLGLVNPPGAPFDFHLPDEPLLPMNPAARVLPVDLVERMLRRRMAAELDYAASLFAALSRHRLLHIESPPPLPTPFIAQHPRVFASKIQQHGISPAPFRYKLWRLHSKIVREHAQQHGVACIVAPPETQDEDGMLKPEFCRDDPTHANPRYGQLLGQQIRSLASAQTITA